MLNLEKFKAIGMMAARNARDKAVQEGTTANEVISMTPLLKEWAPGVHEIGGVVVQNDYPYKVIQAHDSTANPGWTPEVTPSLFAPYHATAKEYALPYRAPTHAGDAYYTGEWMIYAGTLYECLQDAVVYDPEVLPSAWRAAE